MKYTIFTLCLLFLSASAFCQTSIDSLVSIGIQHHDKGEYDQAIGIYKKALEIDPNSSLVHYEISLTYMYAKDYENALLHSEKVIELDNGHIKQAILNKGSALDYLGKTEESIALFKKAIEEYEEDYLLYYNLGLNYFKLNQYNEAEEAVLNAIRVKPSHSSSHLILGYVKYHQQKRPQSLMALYYFLLLEPNKSRAKVAWDLMQQQFASNVTRKEGTKGDINMNLNLGAMNDEFGTAELMISMLAASSMIDTKKDKKKRKKKMGTDWFFVEQTTSFFKVLGELQENKGHEEGIWWQMYVPFFYDLAQSEHMAAYCNYISQLARPESADWLDNNEAKLSAFAEWVKNP